MKPSRKQISWRDPVEAFAPLKDEPFALLLHGPGTRWSYICAAPSRTLTAADAARSNWAEDLQKLLAAPGFQRPEDAPPYCGGWAGLLSYEFGRSLLPNLGALPRPEGWPDIALGYYEEFIVFDHERRIAEHWNARKDSGGRLAERLGADAVMLPDYLSPVPPRPRIEAEEFEARVARAVAYVRAGDCFQVNLSQRFDFELAEGAHPFDLFCKLTRASAAPYSAYFRLPGLALVSNSPEQFLEVRPDTSGGYRARTRPIKGTRPRGAVASEDRQLADDLISSEKDRAENLMIVDLMRNDLARVSQPGSVSVPALFEIESFANVHHLVSTVSSELKPGLGPVDLIRAAFPGGSITGAPKIRAMQIIEELEDEARGPYCGSLVWMTPDGWMDSSILIRTAALVEKPDGWTGHFRAGGGVVSDSVPAKERQETLDKASAMMRALTEDSSFKVHDIVFAGPERQMGATIPARDRSFLLGDGCFETLRYGDGHIEGIAEHLSLLRQSANLLGISGFPPDDALKAALDEACRGLAGEAAVRITLSRGAGGRGAAAARALPLTVISASPLAERRPYPPLRVVTAKIRRNETSPLSRIKATSYGDNLAARREAVEAGADEALMLNIAGRPACLAMGNLFLRLPSGDWVTPPVEEGIRPGYMRTQLIGRLKASGSIIAERPINVRELTESGASLFGVNSLWGVRAIESLDGAPLPVGSFDF